MFKGINKEFGKKVSDIIEKEFDGRLVKARDQVKTIINKIDAIGDDFS